MHQILCHQHLHTPSICWNKKLKSLFYTSTHGHYLISIGWFSEAGLHKWMPFVIFHARCRKRSQHHFQADFWVGVASRYVQWKLNFELWSRTNATSVAVAKITWEGGGGLKKVSLHCFFCWPEDREFVEKMCFGASYSTSNKLLLVARHILTTGLQKCL